MVRVVAAGHVNWDVSLEVDRLPVADDEALVHDQHRAGGGSAANVAAALVGLDVQTGIVGAVGDDRPGRQVRAELVERGVDCECLQVRDGPTTLKYLLVADGGEVAVLGNEGVNEAYAASAVDADRLGRAEHLHLTNQPPETAARLATTAREAGLSVSFDPGRRAGDRDFGAVFEQADLVFATEREAASLGTEPSTLSGPDRLVAVTRGHSGAVLYGSGADDPPLEHAGFPVSAVDTSGAGDAFAAGFLSVWLDGGPLERALAAGNACGALASERRGARSAPDRATVETLLARE